MAEFKFECPCCKQHLQADTSQIGQMAECPSCGTVIKIKTAAKETKQVVNTPASQVSYQCPVCQNTVSLKAANCPSCGEPNPKAPTKTSSVGYIICWLIGGVCGLHNLYAGNTITGAIQAIALIGSIIATFMTGNIIIAQATAVALALWAIVDLITYDWT